MGLGACPLRPASLTGTVRNVSVDPDGGLCEAIWTVASLQLSQNTCSMDERESQMPAEEE